ncbi:MAG: putative metal-binding motif-containing protein [Sandaracinaceae bacterium]
MRLLPSIARAALAIFVCGCGTPVAEDAGVDGSSTLSDRPVSLCTNDRECDDGVYCNGLEQCLPSDASAARDGCVSGSPPCSALSCSEERDRCDCGTAGDADGDGHASIACGGDDCDDDDGLRHPGRAEVCDAEGHDEDCDDSTVGEVDADGDGAISSRCCNGDVCGQDCADDDANVNPGAGELCDARDNNCDGTVDGETAYCPVGVCLSRRCASDDWERLVDGGGSDVVFAVAADAEGNSYAVVNAPEGADLDDDGISESLGAHVISMRPDGRVRWVTAVPDRPRSLAVAPDGSVAVVSSSTILRLDAADGAAQAPVPLAGLSADVTYSVIRSSATRLVVGATVDSRIHVLVFDSSFAELARLVVPSEAGPSAFYDVGISEAGAAVAGRVTNAISLGGVTIGPGRFVLNLDSSLAPRWAWPLPAGSDSNPAGVAISRSGQVVVGGGNQSAFTPPFGGPSLPAPMVGDAYAFLFDPAGTHLFTRVHRGPGDDVFASFAFDERGAVLVSGIFSGSLPVTPRGTLEAGGGIGGFFALWDERTNYTFDARAFTGSGICFVQGVAVDPFGGLLIAGRFSGSVRLLLGSEYSSAGAGFVARASDFMP